MKLYFSGIRSTRERVWLALAGVNRILVSPFDLENVLDWHDDDIILDSDAYAAYKEGRSLSMEEHCALIAREHRRFRHVISKDVFGDPERSHRNWLAMRRRLPKDIALVPVWQWRSKPEAKLMRRLEGYLRSAEVVGIGGLVPEMVERNYTMLDQVEELCAEYPDRFHIFGCCWPEAINRLRATAYSADTSHWLAAARKGLVVFRHDNGSLRHAPAQALNLSHLSIKARCIMSAAAMDEYCNQEDGR